MADRSGDSRPLASGVEAAAALADDGAARRGRWVRLRVSASAIDGVVNSVDRLMDRLGAGELVVIDGATGTECERRGVPKLDGAWNGGAALSHPDVVRQIHRDYLDAGAELIIANTFATHRHALELAGVADDFVAYNRRGVELAVQARAEVAADSAVVAAGISNWTWEGEHPPLDVLVRNSADQAAALAAGGAELLILEMTIDIGRMWATLDGARTVGLPIWVGFTCGSWEGAPIGDDGIVRLLDGESLSTQSTHSTGTTSAQSRSCTPRSI